MDVSFVIFKGARRVTLREADMTVEKISRIFQITTQTLYLTGDDNVAVFPREDGFFSLIDMRDNGHYEEHGTGAGDAAEGAAAMVPLPPPAPSSGGFRFGRLAASASASQSHPGPPRAQSPKYFTRSVSLGEAQSGRLVNTRMVVVRFVEHEASVPCITAKVKEALGSNDPLILTDHNGIEIIDSEGTRGSFYWRQNSRKIMAVAVADFQAVQQRKRRMSRRDGDGLEGVLSQIEEVVLASQGLAQVTTAIQGLSDLARQNTRALVLTQEQSGPIKATFTCAVCRGCMAEPMFATCCESLVACRACTTEWLQQSSLCVKCRADNFAGNTHRVTGLSELLNAIGQLEF